MRRDLIAAIMCTFCLTTALFMMMPTMSSPSVGDYDPWVDINGDGVIDGLDIIQAAAAFGSSGNAKTKASLEYDSHWINITNKQGRYFNLTHGLNSTEVIVDISGKTTQDGEPHHRHFSSPNVWNKTVGEGHAFSVIQTADGRYALTGYGFLLVKTDAYGNVEWTREYRKGTGHDASSVIQTVDGGYALAVSHIQLKMVLFSGLSRWMQMVTRSGIRHT